VTLAEQIRADMSEALKKGDKIRLSTLRIILSDINYAEIEKQKKLDDNGVIEVLAKDAKKHRESIEAFEKGNRQDLVDKEKAELLIVSAYLPKQMSREEIIAAAQDVIAKTGAKGPGDKGKVMSQLVPLTKGKAEGKIVSDVVMELLSK
jgi:uncharacterized protein YqeY